MDVDIDQARSACGSIVGDYRHAARPIARLLEHVPRRLASAIRQPRSSAIQNAMDYFGSDRRFCCDLLCDLHGARSRQPGIYRHAAGVRHCFNWRDCPPRPRTKSCPRVQDAMDMVCGPDGRNLRSLFDDLPPMAHVGTVADLARDRSRNLFFLQRPPQQAEPFNRGTAKGWLSPTDPLTFVGSAAFTARNPGSLTSTAN